MKIPNEAALLEYLSATTQAQAIRNVYKYTDCGAWMRFTQMGVDLGSIVEGSHAEIGPYSLTYPFTSDDWESAMAQIESEAETAWCDANDNTGELA